MFCLKLLNHLRIRTVLIFSALVFSVSVTAADVAAAAEKPATQRLDLQAPPIAEVMTPAQIDAVLRRSFEPRSIEEVEVGSSRINDPYSQTYIPPGFAALFWAAGKPSGLWRLFTPRLVQKARADIDPTNPSRPAPGIPAMAGEDRPYDR
jgi:hypothetical protein